MLRVNFVMEQHLGHQTYYQNLRRFIDGGDGVLANWIPVTYEEAGGTIEKMRFLPPGLRGTLRGMQQVRSGLRRTPADLAFFNTQVPAALGGHLVRRQPYVIATDLTPIQYDGLSKLYNHTPDKPGPLKTFKNRVNQRLFRGASRLLPWSTWARNSMMSDYGVEAGRIEVLPPGVDLTLWHPAEARAAGPLRVLFVGGDFERKGGPLILSALDAFRPGEIELHLVTRSKLPPRASVTVYNDMHPNSPELIALYQYCDVFVLPTGAEAFGIAAVEASAAGLPLIATRSGGLVDIVDQGVTGFLIAPGDLAALVDSLRILTKDMGLRTRMSYAARARAEARFDARKNAARLLECLTEVMRSRQTSTRILAK